MYRLKYTKAFEKDLKKLSPLEQKTVAQKEGVKFSVSMGKILL